MKKLSTILGITVLFILLAAPAFPISLQFDFDGNPNTWENSWTMLPNDVVTVDVWLADYNDVWTVTSVLYKFSWNNAVLSVIDAWPYNTNHGGPWSPSTSYAHLLWNGQYLYKVGSQNVTSNGVVVNGKVKLHSIKLKCLAETVTLIQTGKVVGLDIEIMGYLNGLTKTDFTIDTHAQATIHGPSSCELNVGPTTKSVYFGETVQFTPTESGDFCKTPCYSWEIMEAGSTGSVINSTGLYTAGDTVGTDKIRVIDPCNSNISATATVKVTPCKITIQPESTTLVPNETVQFSAVVSGECSTTCFTWEVVSGAGTIGANGVYTAKAVGTAVVEVTDTCNDGISASATVTVIPCRVAIAPKSENVLPGGTIQFVPTESGVCSAPCYTWEVTASGTTANTASTIDANGLYTAGSILGTETVKVTDKCNKNISDTAIVTVTEETTTTTTIKPQPLDDCAVDKDCDDKKFCNGSEKCVKVSTRNRCKSGANPCPDDELYCTGEERCDEENNVCTNTGDPCAVQGLKCIEENDICEVCVDNTNCDDGIFCNGQETCGEDGVCKTATNPCTDDGKFCTGVESCDEANDTCVSSGDPCVVPTPECDEDEDICKPVTPIPNILVNPDPLLQSHLIPLPALLTVKGKDGAQFDFTSTIEYVPANAFLALPPLVLDADNIFVVGLLMPLWITDSLDSVTVTVMTGSQEAPGVFGVELLPFILGE